jgi:DNA-directed RNA polymerase alpha subunit
MANRPGYDRSYSLWLSKFPVAGYWLKHGLSPRAARELVKAGFHTLEDLGGINREKLSALPGVGSRSLAQLERLLGASIPSWSRYWLERGVRPQVAHALARAGIDSIEKLGGMTREQLLSFSGLGEGALRSCEAALGHPLDSPARE